jgi:hypothetical protein
MKSFHWILALLLAASACKINSPSAQQAQFRAGMLAQQQATAQMQQQQPSVFVRGDVKNQIIPWSEDLSLARAIVAAEYRGPWDPHRILIIRKGEAIKINPKHLIWGTQDPLLEAGDIVEIER